MWYIGCKNHIYSDLKHTSNEEIIISKLEHTSGYTLYTNDLKLWGTKLEEREFVRHNKIPVFSEVPKGLKDSLINNSEFITFNDKFICKTIGRYISIIDEKTWILDVVFNEEFDPNWTEIVKNEYLNGKIGMHLSWKYDMTDATMIDFVMNLIEKLPYNERIMYNIVRTIMCGFSSENCENGLIYGKWGGNYNGGCDPSTWTSTSHIFREWGKHKKPVRYGQCWIFAECMTCVMRFLNIPTRTIFAKNSHINTSLNYCIDFSEDQLSKSGDENGDFYRKIDNIMSFLECSKGDLDDELKNCTVYNSNDSYWNIHYWNEIYIQRFVNNEIIYSWECLDSTPALFTKDEPCKNAKILGPCKVSNISEGKNKIFDFKYLHATINSPFRIWTKDSFLENGEIISVSYVSSLVFPFYPKYSNLNSQKVRKLLTKVITLQTKDVIKFDITSTYKMPFLKLYEYIHQDNPIIFNIKNGKLICHHKITDEEFYVQQVAINKQGNICGLKRQKCKFELVEPLEYDPKILNISILIIKDSDFWCQLITV